MNIMTFGGLICNQTELFHAVTCGFFCRGDSILSGNLVFELQPVSTPAVTIGVGA